MSSTTQYVQTFADYLNKKLPKGQKAARLLRDFLIFTSGGKRETPYTLADMREICRSVGMKTFQRSQWYVLGNPRAEGTKHYRRPGQYTHFFVEILKDHTVFHLVGDHIKLHPRLEGLTWQEGGRLIGRVDAAPAWEAGKFCVRLGGSALPCARPASPAPSAPLPGRKQPPRSAPAFRSPPRKTEKWVDLPDYLQPFHVDIIDEAIDDALRKQALESSSGRLRTMEEVAHALSVMVNAKRAIDNTVGDRPRKRQRIAEVITVVDVKPKRNSDYETDSDADEEQHTFFY